MVRLFGAVFGFMLMTGVAFAQDADAPEPEAPPPEEEVVAPANAVSVQPVARDGEIEKRIREIMKATGWYENPGVAVDDGVVFLDGIVKTDEHKTWARELSQKTQDVVAVVNRIQVEQQIQSSFTPAVRELKAVLWSAVLALPHILLALVILPLAWYGAKWVSRGARVLLRGRIESPFLRDVLARAIAVPVFLIGLYIVLQVAGLTRLAVSFLGGAGVIGIVIGFAFRDIAENFLASLLLSIRRPFKGGDFIDVADQQGIVQSMNTRSTILLSVEGNHIQIPNATIFKNTIVNFSAAPSRRSQLDIGVGYDVSTATAQEVVRRVLHAHEAVMKEPEPLVLVDSLGASTVATRC
jgi:small-conductance mechanosensitive channel